MVAPVLPVARHANQLAGAARCYSTAPYGTPTPAARGTHAARRTHPSTTGCACLPQRTSPVPSVLVALLLAYVPIQLSGVVLAVADRSLFSSRVQDTGLQRGEHLLHRVSGHPTQPPPPHQTAHPSYPPARTIPCQPCPPPANQPAVPS